MSEQIYNEKEREGAARHQIDMQNGIKPALDKPDCIKPNGDPLYTNDAAWIEQVLLPWLEATHVRTNSQRGDYYGSDSMEYIPTPNDIKEFILSRKDEWGNDRYNTGIKQVCGIPVSDGREVDELWCKVYEFVQSPAGKASIGRTMAEVKKIIAELDEQRRIDPKTLNQPMTI